MSILKGHDISVHVIVGTQHEHIAGYIAKKSTISIREGDTHGHVHIGTEHQLCDIMNIVWKAPHNCSIGPVNTIAGISDWIV